MIEDRRSCSTDDDCQILDGQCSVDLGGCYEYVNLELKQAQLSELAERFVRGL